MQSAREASPATVPSTPSPGRRLLSRFASGLASKPRSVADFFIQADEPHRQYSTGDTVKGSVRLRVLRPLRITHLVVSLHGYAQVYKNPGAPADGGRSTAGHISTAGRGNHSGYYHGNGLATLFEDEVILCGDGRLAEGSYQFNFELQFPDGEMPSSIDFERGTISYMMTATITRPTTISPTLTCERKIFFVEAIDISPLFPPKPRTITLEPIPKKAKTKAQALKLMEQSERKSFKSKSSVQGDQASQSTISRPSESNYGGDIDRPLSPVPSEVSTSESHVSSVGVSSQNDSVSVSPRNSAILRISSGRTSHASKTISATIESCAGGCLRGDYVPIKVTVNHTKYIKSMKGVIATLYRQARVDLNPAMPITSPDKNGAGRADDLHPRSLSGLGGLSLSGAGTSHIFRKDLAQVVLPLVVNPSTLAAEVVAKLRVPEEAFPTIASVPASMISFKYFIEVIVDIQGKLSGQERALSSLGGLTNTTMTASDLNGGDWEALNGTGGARVLDTTSVRRDRGVVCCSFEIVIGTRDSERRKGKRRVEAVPYPTGNGAGDGTARDISDSESFRREYARTPMPEDQQRQRYEHDYWSQPPDEYVDPRYDPPPDVAFPDVVDESELSEKERIRRAEARLLPSQPPDMDGEASGGGESEATAPMLPPDDFDTGASPQYYSAHFDYASPIASSSYSHAPNNPARHQHLWDGTQSSSRTTVLPSNEPQESDGADSRLETQTASSHEVATHDGSPHDSHADASASSDLPRYER